MCEAIVACGQNEKDSFGDPGRVGTHSRLSRAAANRAMTYLRTFVYVAAQRWARCRMAQVLRNEMAFAHFHDRECVNKNVRRRF